MPAVSTGVVTPRHREISWTDEEKYCTALEVYADKIIVGWNNGEIKIYNSASLNCEMVLNYYTSKVTCLQCPGTEIIAGYEDGVICVWNIETEDLMMSHPVSAASSGRNFLTCMTFRDPALLVGCVLNDGVLIWRYVNSSFTYVNSWDAGENHIQDVDFNENYIVLRPRGVPQPVHVHDFNGQRLRTIFPHSGTFQMALYGNQLVTSDRRGVLQIWDICRGRFLKELLRAEIYVFSLDAHNGVIATASPGGGVIVWSMQEVLGGSQDQLAVLSINNEIKCVTFDVDLWEIKLGPNVLVARSSEREHQRKIFVTYF